MTTHPKTARRNLDRAGYVHVEGWVPAEAAEALKREIDAHRGEVERILAVPAQPRGRPTKASRGHE